MGADVRHEGRHAVVRGRRRLAGAPGRAFDVRAGAALGLGVVASPVASVLAFIDPGDAKAAACGPVLAGATAKAQRTTKGKPRDDVGKGTTAKSESGKQSRAEARKQHKKFLGIF
jgi:hypothetical protein